MATLGLVCARGAKTHALVDFAESYGFATHGFGEGPFGGGWAWQPFEDPKWPLRSSWYDQTVKWRLVLPPFEDADAWLSDLGKT
jgi:hypothetical protein